MKTHEHKKSTAQKRNECAKRQRQKKMAKQSRKVNRDKGRRRRDG